MRRILVVDDNSVNRKLAIALLKKRGWEIAEAQSGEQALEMLRASPFDYVLLDIGMPGIDGCEVCRRIRLAGVSGLLRVIAYTAHAMESEKQEIMAAGFDDIIIKPVTIDGLNAMFPD